MSNKLSTSQFSKKYLTFFEFHIYNIGGGRGSSILPWTGMSVLPLVWLNGMPTLQKFDSFFPSYLFVIRVVVLLYTMWWRNTQKVRNERNKQKILLIEWRHLAPNVFVQHLFKFHQGVTSIWIWKWK